MPHSDHDSTSPKDTFADLPPFPNTIPTAPLLRISLEKLLQHDPDEEETCWKACSDLGFFYLDLRTSDPSKEIDGEELLKNADQLFEVMKTFFELSISDKLQYDFSGERSYFGYKGYGDGIIDAKGTKDRNEFYNLSKDDILALSPPLPSPVVLTPHRALYTSYINASHRICMLITALLSSRLPLTQPVRDAGGLPALHTLRAPSGDQIRFIKAPPQGRTLQRVALGEHTDFGSVTVLFNRLGGLQVQLPSYISALPPTGAGGQDERMTPFEHECCKDGWTYVRPLPGHAIINLGDALVKFSDGALRSNIHRVVPPPGRQGDVTRYSLVYFCRPRDEVLLRGLVGGAREEEERTTAKEWILRRSLGKRRPDGWEESMGTEGESRR